MTTVCPVFVFKLFRESFMLHSPKISVRNKLKGYVSQLIRMIYKKHLY